MFNDISKAGDRSKSKEKRIESIILEKKKTIPQLTFKSSRAKKSSENNSQRSNNLSIDKSVEKKKESITLKQNIMPVKS